MIRTGYEPLNTLKPVAQGLWIVDGAPLVRSFVPIPMRAAVVQLQGGGLWVYAPVAITDGLASELSELGPVDHIVAPNEDYATAAKAWVEAYPDATYWDTTNLNADGAQDVWKGQLHQLLVRVRPDRTEAVFCHRPSRTLFFADLIERLETALLPPWVRPIVWLSGTDDSTGHMRPTHRWGRKYDDKIALGRQIETIVQWAPRGMIPGHGRPVEGNAVKHIERAFRKELRPLRWETAFQKKGS